MRVSIRSKVVVLLTLVALVPLLAALAIIYFGGREVRLETAGRNIQTIATGDAFMRAVSFTKDIEKFLLSVQDPVILDALRPEPRQLSQKELDDLDNIWKIAPPEGHPRIKETLDHPVAKVLKKLLKDARITEAFITDRYGQLVASTVRTDDFYQADEEWWQITYNKGKGKIYSVQTKYAAETKVWTTDRCIPIFERGKFLGVLKIEMDLSSWVKVLRFTGTEVDAHAMLIGPGGRIAYREDLEPMSRTMDGWTRPLSDMKIDGWRITPAGDIQGYAPIPWPQEIDPFSVEIPPMLLVLYISEADVLGPVYWLSLLVAGAGLIIIILIFGTGFVLADRSIIRRIQRLESATGDVARGEFSRRIPSAWGGKRWLGEDEIDDLAEDFNEMVARVQNSHDALVAANQLKTNFIRVAGHELRTPVSYIIGMSRLLRDSTDSGKLLYAVQSMGSKAKRLEEIIQAIFKLMPDQQAAEELAYATVVLPELLEEIYLDAYPFVEKRGQRLVIESDEQLPSLKADREKLRDIIENLVMNAIQFTPDGGTIRIRTGRQLGGFVTVAVQDQGPGIPEAEVPHIFKPFYSGGDVLRHTSTAGYQRRGMGLGLAIVKHFVDLHKGNVSLTTGPSGSTFTVSIPVEPLPTA